MSEPAPIRARPLAKWQVVLQLPDADPTILRKSDLLRYYSYLRAGWDVFWWALDEYGTVAGWEERFSSASRGRSLGDMASNVTTMITVIETSLRLHATNISNGDWSSTEAMLFAAWPDHRADIKFMRSIRLVNDPRVRKNVRADIEHHQIIERTMRLRIDLLERDESFQSWWQSGVLTNAWVKWARIGMDLSRQAWEEYEREHAEWLKTQMWIGPDGREYSNYEPTPKLGPVQPTWEDRQLDQEDGRYLKAFKIGNAEWEWVGDDGNGPSRAEEWKHVRGDPKSTETIIRPSDPKPTDPLPPTAVTIDGEKPPRREEKSRNRYMISTVLNQVLITDSETGETKILADAGGHQYGVAFADMKLPPSINRGNTPEIRGDPIDVVIYPGREHGLAEPAFTFIVGGEITHQGRIEYYGPDGGLGLFIHGGEIYGPNQLEIEYGPPQGGWSDYQRGVVEAVCAMEGSQSRIRG